MGMPQVLPLAQEAPEELLEPVEKLGAAMRESCFSTCPLLQDGQTTSVILEVLRTSSSKLSPHSWQTKPNIGIDKILL
jgi:hypothetical protein